MLYHTYYPPGPQSTMYRTFYLLNSDVGAQFYLICFVTCVLAVFLHLALSTMGVMFPDTIRIVKERVKLRVHDVIVMPKRAGGEGAIVVPHKHAGADMAAQLALAQAMVEAAAAKSAPQGPNNLNDNTVLNESSAPAVTDSTDSRGGAVDNVDSPKVVSVTVTQCSDVDVEGMAHTPEGGNSTEIEPEIAI